MTGWTILNDSGSLIAYTRQREGYKEYMNIDLEQKTVSFSATIFIPHSDEVVEAQSQETNDIIKYSAYYGSWHGECPELTKEDLEFALKALKKAINARQTERSEE